MDSHTEESRRLSGNHSDVRVNIEIDGGACVLRVCQEGPSDMFFFFDPLYMILTLACLALSGWAAAKTRSTFRRFSRVGTGRGLTGAEVARKILSDNGIHDVEIEPVRGTLSDHIVPFVSSATKSTLKFPADFSRSKLSKLKSRTSFKVSAFSSNQVVKS